VEKGGKKKPMFFFLGERIGRGAQKMSANDPMKTCIEKEKKERLARRCRPRGSAVFIGGRIPYTSG